MENSSSYFDMSSLQSEIPNQRGGLSRWYSGKSRSFTCMDDVKCIADLKKPELPEAKAKKYSSRQGFYPPPACRRKSPCTNLAG